LMLPMERSHAPWSLDPRLLLCCSGSFPPQHRRMCQTSSPRTSHPEPVSPLHRRIYQTWPGPRLCPAVRLFAAYRRCYPRWHGRPAGATSRVSFLLKLLSLLSASAEAEAMRQTSVEGWARFLLGKKVEGLRCRSVIFSECSRRVDNPPATATPPPPRPKPCLSNHDTERPCLYMHPQRQKHKTVFPAMRLQQCCEMLLCGRLAGDAWTNIS